MQIFCGLTQADANAKSKAPIKSEHTQKVQAFKTKLDGIIAHVKTNAAKQKQELKQHGWFGRGWMYTESFFEGLGSGVWDGVKGVGHALSAGMDEMAELGNALYDSVSEGDVEPIKTHFAKLGTKIKATTQDFAKLGRLIRR